ncbi:MAG TPA: hypothetical protein VIV40_30005 [Kofleriaceae bacterium]
MKFDAAIQAVGTVTWDWSEAGFASLLEELGITREPDADPEMPNFLSPWGKEWVQAHIEDGAAHRIEFLVEERSPGWRLFNAKKLDVLGRKYRDKLAVYVKQATAVLGVPAFYGDQGKPGFPDDEEGYVLAMWRRDTARIMLAARNEGPDTPFWISIIVKPSAAARAPTSRASRPVMRAPTRQSASSLDAQLGARFDTAIKTLGGVRWDWAALDLAPIVAEIGLRSTGDAARIELVVESKSPVSDGFDEDELEDLDTEYYEKFEGYVQRAQRVLGKPKFNDGAARKGFPKDETANFLALWPLKKARLMIMFRNQGAASPFEIVLVVKP